MIDEVYSLHYNRNISWKRLESFGLEYRWISRYLRGDISQKEMKGNLLVESRHYAKRQITWLRRWERQGKLLHWSSSKKEALRIAKRLIEQSE